MLQRIRSGALALLALAVTAAIAGGCGSERELILATTTSTQDSGLLDELLPRFERESGVHVKLIAVGSGAALRLGSNGDADALLVHSPADEQAFVAAGHGIERTRVMYNDFVIVGPPADPAAIRGTRAAADALHAIARARAAFISRGDDSGTHAKELALWKLAGIAAPEGAPWYAESGQGMGATLTMAAQTAAYTITDRATWLAHAERAALPLAVEGDATLLNVYHVIVVNPAQHPRVHADEARRLRDFLVAPATQQQIGNFGRERFGQPLFVAYAE